MIILGMILNNIYKKNYMDYKNLYQLLTLKELIIIKININIIKMFDSKKAEMYTSELNALFNTFIFSKIYLMQKLCSHLDVDKSPYRTTEDIYCYLEDEMEGFLYKSDVIEFKREIEYFLDITLYWI